MTDRAALLAAICRDPADDTVRMVYADRLQEQAGSVECPAGCRVPSPRRDGIHCTYDSAGPDGRWVKCSTCSGSGRVSDGNAERAEFIRCQIRLARPPWNSKDMIRSEQLLTAHEAEWRRGDKCERCRGKRFYRRAADGSDMVPTCCHGIGFTGSLAAGSEIADPLPGTHEIVVGRRWCWRYKADWSRGFVSAVHAPLADVFQGEKVTGWAKAVAREWPVERWVLTDREPSEYPGFEDGPNQGRNTHDWYDTPIDEPDDVPECVLAEMVRQHSEWNYQYGVLECPTRESALDAFARAVAEVVRREAWEKVEATF